MLVPTSLIISISLLREKIVNLIVLLIKNDVTTISAISAMKVFTEIYVMTKGGPLNSSKTIVYYIYERAFENLDLGYASALAVVLLVIVMIFSLINILLSKKIHVNIFLSIRVSIGNSGTDNTIIIKG